MAAGCMIATSPPNIPCTQLLVLLLDVTNEAQVKSVFTQAKDAFGRVEVMYDHAGQGV